MAVYLISFIFSIQFLVLYSFSNDFSFEKAFVSFRHGTRWSLRRCVYAFITFNGILSLVRLIAYAVFNLRSFSSPAFSYRICILYKLFIKTYRKSSTDPDPTQNKITKQLKTKESVRKMNDKGKSLSDCISIARQTILSPHCRFTFIISTFWHETSILNRKARKSLVKMIPFDFRFLFSLDTLNWVSEEMGAKE